MGQHDSPTSEQTLLPEVVYRAICLAASAHRTQTRKASDLPYISHPAAVASILVQAGVTNPNIIAAAWLHDVVEDTAVTIEDIAAQFPAEVVTLVDFMSETKRDQSGTRLSWAERKAAHIRKMATASVEARTIMLADKLHNMTTMLADQSGLPDFWNRFNAPKSELLNYYASMVATADDVAELARLRTECHRAIAALRGV